MLFDEMIHLKKFLEKNKLSFDLHHFEEWILLTNSSYIKLYILILRIINQKTLNPMIIKCNLFSSLIIFSLLCYKSIQRNHLIKKCNNHEKEIGNN